MNKELILVIVKHVTVKPLFYTHNQLLASVNFK